MATLTPAQLHIFWYLLAGFVLGFAFSTLWEWLYFRRLRLGNNQAQPTAARTQAWRASNEEGQPAAHLAHSERPAMHYQSQGVLLENEQSTDQLFVAEVLLGGALPVVEATPLVAGTPLPVRKVTVPANVDAVTPQPPPLAPISTLADEEATLNSVQENI